MINSVIVRNLLSNESIELVLDSPEKSGIAIASIDGLGGAKATINMREGASYDGALYNSSRLETRNITFGLYPYGDDIEASRHKIYKYFSTKNGVELIFNTNSQTLSIMGYVESCEASIFSEQEEVQVSIICPDPLFSKVGEMSKSTFSALVNEFEFPYYNDANYNHTPPIINQTCMGDIERFVTQSIYYSGDEDTGVIITAHILSPITELAIYETYSRKKIELDVDRFEQLTGYAPRTGDDIIISTIHNDRYARLLRDGETTNILSCFNKDIAWFQLHQGDNVFTYVTNDDEAFRVVLTIEYQEKYKGL